MAILGVVNKLANKALRAAGIGLGRGRASKKLRGIAKIRRRNVKMLEEYKPDPNVIPKDLLKMGGFTDNRWKANKKQAATLFKSWREDYMPNRLAAVERGLKARKPHTLIQKLKHRYATKTVRRQQPAHIRAHHPFKGQHNPPKITGQEGKDWKLSDAGYWQAQFGRSVLHWLKHSNWPPHMKSARYRAQLRHSEPGGYLHTPGKPAQLAQRLQSFKRTRAKKRVVKGAILGGAGYTATRRRKKEGKK